jgi:hypothetical protein
MRYHIKKLSILLITAALIAGMVGCGPVQYNLTISSTEGGNVTTPGEGTFTYDAGTVVSLNATPDAGYSFVNWTGNVSIIADVNAAVTTVTMNGDYTITANFAIAAWDWYDLDTVRNNLAGSYILMNDLDSTTAGYEELASPTANNGTGWEPIGTEDQFFTGSFDGQGYEIRDLFMNRPDETLVGLFGTVDEEGVVENIGVVNAIVTGGVSVGGLVGDNLGNVTNCYAIGNVTGYDIVGGLVGVNGGNMSYCYSASSVIGTGSTGELRVVGGLVGANAGNMSYCYSTGGVTGDGFVGGLMGFNWLGTVSDSYSTGSVSGQDCVGGLVGVNGWGTVSNSYATGSVTGTSYVGGLMGGNPFGTVSNSYSTGSVTGNTSVGGLLGYNGNNGTVSNSFWDTETSGQTTSDGGTSENTTEMHNIATFSGAGWNITAVANPGTRNPSYIWNIVDTVTYPFLSWQPV